MKSLILGTSLRGLPDAARVCLEEGDSVVMYDAMRPDPPLDLAGRVDVLPTKWEPAFLDGVDRVITSPWFPEVDPPIRDVLERGVDVITEAGFGLAHLDVPFVAVTGTNGKTTVTEVITEMLTASGIRAVGAGNLGNPVSSMRSSDADVLVLELSSYQLRFLGEAAPDAGALLNIAPDHLDWHGSFEAYARAKAMIFERMASDAVLAFNVDDPVTVTTVARADCALVPCSGHHVPDGGNGVDRGDIVVNGHRFPAPIDDPSFLFDLVAAATVAFAVGGNVEGIGASIAAFSPGDHRRQQVSTTDGIRWIDDSKATNPHAAAAAVAAYAPVILLAGGRNKGLDLSPLGDLDGVEHLIAFGESGEAIASSTSGVSTLVRTLAEAVDAARSIAHPGDTVLLSPGCASFDEFDSYAQRGDVFQTLARQAGGTAV